VSSVPNTLFSTCSTLLGKISIETFYLGCWAVHFRLILFQGFYIFNEFLFHILHVLNLICFFEFSLSSFSCLFISSSPLLIWYLLFWCFFLSSLYVNINIFLDEFSMLPLDCVVSFGVQVSLIWFSPICQFLGLFPAVSDSYSESHCLCLYLEAFPPWISPVGICTGWHIKI
jgi:hypothetical protein